MNKTPKMGRHSKIRPRREQLEGVSALQIIPAELWTIVLGNLEKSEDLVNCVNATSAWSKLLYDKSSSIYFPLIFRHLLPYLDRQDFLKCCQLSHSMIKTVDSAINYSRSIQKTLRPYLRDIGLNLEFDATLPFYNLVDNPSEPLAPFQYRHIKVTIDHNLEWFDNDPDQVEADEFENHITKMSEFFKLYGHLTHHLSFTFTWCDQITNPHLVEMLRNFLVSTPSLRKLSVVVSGPDVDVEELNAIKTMLKQNPLPNLPHLNDLDGEHCSRRLMTLFLTRYGAQIKHLNHFLVPDFNSDEKIADPDPDSLPEQFDDNISCFVDHITYHPNALRTLKLKFVWNLDSDVDVIVNAIRALFIHQTSLKKLTLNCKDFRRNVTRKCDVSHFCGVKLTQLKYLCLIDFGFPTIDVLKTFCPSLETLVLKHVGHHKMENSNMYLKLHEKSEFWEEMRRVKVVRVDVPKPAGSYLGRARSSIHSFAYSRRVYEQWRRAH